MTSFWQFFLQSNGNFPEGQITSLALYQKFQSAFRVELFMSRSPNMFDETISKYTF